MSRQTSIKIVVHTMQSRVDRNGNTYTLASFYSPKRGKGVSVTIRCHSPSNAACMAREATGANWSSVLVLNSDGIALRRLDAMSKGALWEWSDDAALALKRLIGRGKVV